MVDIFNYNALVGMAVLSKYRYCQVLCSLKCPLKVKTFP